MAIKKSIPNKIFSTANYIILSSVTLVCILPFIHLLSVSLSSDIVVAAGEIGLFPKEFTLNAYQFLAKKPEFFRAIFISFERLLLGTAINMVLIIITAYPLSKTISDFKMRTVYVWFFAFTMFFGGGMIPTYMVVKMTGIIDTIWALIIPGALSVWNTVLLLNFFRQVPKELEEAAIIDGAGHWTTLFKVYLPVSTPAIATILLFTVIWHWNSWFDGILYLNTVEKYPLQTYLYTIVTSLNMNNMRMLSPEAFETIKDINDKTVKTAQVFLGALPIIILYPFLQRFFVKGIIVGSVKG